MKRIEVSCRRPAFGGLGFLNPLLLTMLAFAAQPASAADSAPSTIDFQTVGGGVSEVGQTTAVLNVVRLGSLEGTATVHFTTSNGTAKAGLDFVGQSGTLTFLPGQQFQTITITGLDDTLVEGTEDFTVVLSDVTGPAQLGLNPVSYLSVSDNECLANLVEGTFDPLEGPADSISGAPYVHALALQADGRIVVGGLFDRWAEKPRRGVARLEADGSLDDAFRPAMSEGAEINAVRIQSDGGILVAGRFRAGTGLDHANIARFQPDGSLDPSFGASLPGNAWPKALVLQADGKIIVAGLVDSSNAQPPFLIRYQNNGVVDPGFVPPAFQSSDVIDSLALQSDQKILVGGTFDQGNESVRRLNPNGSRDLSLIPPVHAGLREAFSLATQVDGKIVVGGSALPDTAFPPVARLNVDGSIDPTFQPGIHSQNPYITVQALAVQPDGRIVLGGLFFPIEGHLHFGIARLNADGSEDASFDVGFGINGQYIIVNALEVQPDGRILMAGGFSLINDISRASIARLLPQNPSNTVEFPFPEIRVAEPGTTTLLVRRCGNSSSQVTVDYSFVDGTAGHGKDFFGQAGTLTFAPYEIDKTISIAILDDSVIEPDEQFRVTLSHPGGGAILGANASARVTILDNDHAPSNVDYSYADREFGNGIVNAMSLQPDGKLLIGGDLFLIEGGTLHDVGRLYADGTPDPTFDPGPVIHTLEDEGVLALGQQPDGKVLFGGSFYLDPDGRRPGLARLNADGSLDDSFLADLDGASVRAIVVFPDGSFLAGGHEFSASPNFGLARFNLDGIQDTNFVGTINDGSVDAIAEDGNERILVGGNFGQADGEARFNLARLHRDGSLDPGFAPVIADAHSVRVLSIQLQNDGKIVIGGQFDRVNGVPRKNIARLHEDGSVDLSFNPDAGTDFMVNAVLVQGDGRIVLGGDFWQVNGYSSRALARLNADGSFDIGFAPQAAPDMHCSSLALQPDGKILAGGFFCRRGPGDDADEFEYCYGVVRLTPDPPPKLAPPQPLPNGAMLLTPSVLPGRTYQLEATTDLIHWNSIATNRVVTPTAPPVIDSDAASYRQRFYRLNEQP